MDQANIGPKIVLEGEKEYRQSIADVNSSMKLLRSELKAVSAEYDGNANSIEALRARNSVLTKQQEEQEKKLQLLRGALESVSQKYGENSNQAKEWESKLNNAYAELLKINKAVETNHKYMDEAEASTNKTTKSIDEFGKVVKNTEEKTLSFGDVLKANVASDVIVNGVKMIADKAKDLVTGMVDLTKEAASYADEILTTATNTGIATDRLQELSYMAELTDTSIDTVTSTMARNIRSMASAQKGTSDFVNAYKTLKVNALDPITGALRDSETVYWEVIDALGKMSNETERDAIAMTLFGRSAQDLNSLIAVGSKGVAEFSQEARNVGAVLDQETLKKLGQTDDALQRLSQQWGIAKRTVAVETAPAMTEAIGKITEKIGEVDDKFADFADGAISGVTDGLIWLIDNADMVAAGLKGIAAAIITKKAADGVSFAVQAYQTLTTVTETATVAQTAFNVATKANVIGLVASAVIGLGTAFYSYVESTNKATEATEESESAYDKLFDSIQKNKETREENKKSIQAEYGAIQSLSDKLYDLAGQENKSNSVKQEMLTLVDQLNTAIPDLNLSIDKQTGLLSKQKEETDKLIASGLKYAEVLAAQDDLNRIGEEKYKADQELNDMIAEREAKKEEYDALYATWSKVMELQNKGYIWLTKSEKDFYNQNKNVTDQLNTVSNKIAELDRNINSAGVTIDDLGKQWSETVDYIGKNSDASMSSISAVADKYNQSISSISSAAVDSVSDASSEIVSNIDDAMGKIDDLYDAADKELKDRLDGERKAFEDTQKAEVDALEKAKQKELDILKQTYENKINDGRNKELSGVQGEIDKIDATQEAEDRALKLKEETQKRIDLQTNINNAKTAEDRIAAMQELSDFEDDVRRENLKAERETQKQILEDRLDNINSAYDAKLKSLDDEQTDTDSTIKTEYEKEKKAIEDKYKLKAQELQDEQKLEQDTFDAKQEAQIQFLADQKALAIKNAQETYDEDLRLYKLNNALKYNETDAIKNLKADDLYSGKTKITSDMLYGYSRYSSGGYTPYPETQQITIDYSEIEGAFTSALKNLNLTVVIDGKKFGAIIESKVNQMVR